MIVRLSGVLDAVEGGSAIISSADGSIARRVLVPAVDAALLTERLGERVTLHTLEYYEASGQGSHLTPRMLGFAAEADRRFFELFTTVKGIGMRRALRAMAMPVADIATAIAARDVKRLTTLPEIGKRTAEAIAAELHDRVSEFAVASPPGAASGAPATAAGSSSVEATAVAALIQLGETRVDAESLVHRAASTLEDPSADELLAAAFAMRS
ncbi:MAG: Holliday junction branch migration protein RuvA [Planctomycetota bacterium]